jgi:lipopolysaccharide transport system ATP-binding protein
MSAIVASGLGKAYRQYPNRWARLAEWTIPFGGPRHVLKQVLQDISFTVEPGEAVGIVGINGAGKSTLLKMITGTTQPTTGTVRTTGRIAALLELGMGFHPDFTGRQNVHMAGQLLGFDGDEIAAMMPEVEAFAEIGDYIDQPVRVYSSGMQVRLAFSVATAHRPDVLIVDEALSVGDAYFQHKSIGRIREFRRLGTTLLIVSHDRHAIQGLCDRVLLLSGGRIARQGGPEEVMDYYNALLARDSADRVRQQTTEAGRVQTISGTGEVVIDEVALLDERGQPVEVANVGQALRLRVAARATAAVPELVMGYMIKDRLGQAVFGTNTFHLKRPLGPLSAGERVVFAFDFVAGLGEGSYSISVALHTADSHVGKNYEWRDLSVVFSVVNLDKPTFIGVAWLPPSVEGPR